MATILFKNVDKFYSDNAHIVKDFNLTIEEGEFVVFLGPSGCGKSTTLRMLSGLEEITKGEILIGDKIVNDLSPKDRNIAMVFQSYALYPHMTVAENIGFSLKMEGRDKAEVNKKVREIADMLQLTPLLERKPRALSGGQRQRVAMGRAMVRTPDVFLFDEPLSNLDAKLRNTMRTEIKELHSKHKTTTVYVTHDQVEAMTLADKVVILRDGVIEQVGTPKEIYHHPINEFVAGFIGTPTMNMLPVELKKVGANCEVVLSGEVIDTILDCYLEEQSQHATLGFRASDVSLIKMNGDSDLVLPMTVDSTELLGTTMLVHGRISGVAVTIEVDANTEFDKSVELAIYVNKQRIHLFDYYGKAMF